VLFFPKVSAKEGWVTVLACIGYMLLSWLLIGFKTEQVVLVVIFLALYYVSAPTRKLITAFSVFIVFWIIFDYMKAFPNYMVNHVHTGDLYELDKGLFGTYAPDGALISVNEYWALHPTTFLDILSGCFYLCWIPVPLGFGVYLFYKKRAGFLPFALTFLFVNLLGFVIYYIYPAAPPWYIRLYGFPVHLSTPGNTAGLQRFDDYFHTGIFHALYAKSSNVFAAMPSLHAAYPLITFYYGLKNRVGWLNLFLGLVVLGIWFAAIYTGHHYVLDVLAGITCALVGIFIFQKILLRTHWFNRFLETFQRLIA
jgi:hypothetical protein